MDKEKLSWRSFADHGDGGKGRPICEQWNVVGTPALFIVDHKGVLRHKWLGSPKIRDAALQRVLKEAERDAQSGQ
jgi:hypothetical protein